MISRRGFLKGLAAFGAGTVGLAGYAFGIEPRWRLVVTRYSLSPPAWPAGFRLKLAVIADVHAGEPDMSPARIEKIVAVTNDIGADVVLLLGDYVAGHHWRTRMVPAAEWAPILAQLKAPLGVHAVLGNHDWWDDHTAQRRGSGPVIARLALESAGVPVYENDAVRLELSGQAFWLAGLGDQWALLGGARWKRPSGLRGFDDVEGTLAKITDGAPIILMAHEPDIFPRVPPRVALTVAGHTHGGQVRLFGYSPIVPSSYGNRYAYGHIVEKGSLKRTEQSRHLVVSGGLGTSIMPVRFGVPPEIVVIELGGGSGAA